MFNKLKHFSYQQLLLVKFFLSNPGKVSTIKEMSKATQLTGKSLGGVLSSLSRTTIKGVPFIEAYGKATDGSGLRWKLNKSTVDPELVKKEVRRLLTTYA